AGICSPDNGHNRPLNTVVFLCPPKTQTVLFRLLFIMAGYYRQTLKSLADSVIGTANLFYPATQCFAALGGGYSYLTESPQMNTPQSNSAQISEQPQIQELQALISQINYWSDAVIDQPSSRSTLGILTDETENLLVHLKAMRDRLAAIAGGAK
ncbi:MAG: hypothetical protein ACNA7G_15465, partial [Methylobacter sp.]